MRFSDISPAVAIAICLLFSVPSAAQNATCYYPDGSVASGRVPCLATSSDYSACCEGPAVCTTGGYCLNAQGIFARSSCTDQTWKSSFCPNLCVDVYVNGVAYILPCNPGVPSNENWVCGDPGQPTTNFCDSPSFYFLPGAAFNIQGPQATTTSSVTVTVSGTASSSSTVATSASAQPQSSSCPSNKGTIIGVSTGLGVGLGLLSIAALSALFLERRKRKSAEKAAGQTQALPFYPDDAKKDFNNSRPQEAGSQTLHEIGYSYRS